jgi:iron complex outermembrane receptor protein
MKTDSPSARLFSPILACLLVFGGTRPTFLMASDGFPDAASNSTDLTQLSIEELMNIPVSSASKFSQPMQDAPAYVTVITADEIKRFGWRTLGDILQSVSGFYISYDRNYDYVGVRGFNRPGDYNTRTLLLLNGHRMNENIYDSNGIGTDAIVDVDMIDRIEIVRGPASVLYGTSAFFAVINIITRDVSTMNGHGEVSVDAGSYDTYKYRFSCAGKTPNGLEMLFSGSFFTYGGQNLYFKEFDAPETNNGRASRQTDKDDFESMYMNMHYGALTFLAGRIWREKRIPTASYDTIFNADRTLIAEERDFAELTYEQALGADYSAVVKASYDDYIEHGDYIYDFGEVGNPADFGAIRDRTRGEWITTEAKLSTTAIDRNRLTAGVECRDNFRQNERNFNQSASEISDNFNSKRNSIVWAFYAQDEARIFKNVLLNLGGRYDHYESFGGEASPRIALVYQPTVETTVKLLYGEAFRAPNIYELYYHDFESQKSNPDLAPERINTVEVVIQQKIAQTLHGILSLYHYTIDDLIGQTVDPADGLIVFNNLYEVNTDGGEAVLVAKLSPDVTGRISYSYSDCHQEDSLLPLSNSPRHMGKMSMTVPVMTPKLSAGIELQYTSERKTLTGQTCDDYLIANLTLFSHNPFPDADISASLYNVFDTRYTNPGSEEHTQDELEQNGRTFRVKLTYRF